MSMATWTYPVLPSKLHIYRCAHPHTCAFSSACLRQATREPWISKRRSKMWHSHTGMRTLTILKIGSHPCPHSNPEGTDTNTVPQACNLHLGEGIFHLAVTATGPACIPTHRETRTHTFYLIHCPHLLPCVHSVNIKGPTPQTHRHKQKQSTDSACQPANADVRLQIIHEHYL